MPEYLDDPSVLTKDKLKNELLAHNVELPSGNPTKDVLVQLYLDNISGHDTAAFSSDEELPPVVVTSRSRSSGRKAVRKTDKVPAAEPDITELTDQGLKDELLKHGVSSGPIVATTRKLYEKKLQKILDNGPTQVTQLVVTETQTEVDLNGNSESDPYSDKEDEAVPEPEPEPQTQIEPEPEPEPVPVVERPLRSRGKTPVTTRSSSSKHKVVEKIAASEPPPKVEESDILKELLPNDINSPTRIFATCRRPIKEAAGRPVKSSDLWNNENTVIYPKTTKTSSSSSFYTQSHIVNRVNSQPLSSAFTPTSSYTSSSSSSFSSSSSRPLSAAPPAVQTKAAPSRMSLWKKLLLLAVVAAFLFLVYQAMETNSASPFKSHAAEEVGGSTA